jgi:hypothetical protein
MHRNALVFLAEQLSYAKTQRLAEWAKLNMEKSDRLLGASVRTERAIFFFPNVMFEISPFGGIHRYLLPSANEVSGNYILFGPELSEKYLRKLFTGLELVLFKLYHVACKNSEPSVHFEQLKTKQTLNKLRKTLGMPDWDQYTTLFDELFFVRNAFAHSFVELEDIKYFGFPLRECFGDSYLGRSYRGNEAARIFMDDARAFVQPLITTFSRFQMEQIDKDKLFRLCISVLKMRSLMS